MIVPAPELRAPHDEVLQGERAHLHLPTVKSTHLVSNRDTLFIGAKQLENK